MHIVGKLNWSKHFILSALRRANLQTMYTLLWRILICSRTESEAQLHSPDMIIPRIRCPSRAGTQPVILVSRPHFSATSECDRPASLHRGRGEKAGTLWIECGAVGRVVRDAAKWSSPPQPKVHLGGGQGGRTTSSSPAKTIAVAAACSPRAPVDHDWSPCATPPLVEADERSKNHIPVAEEPRFFA